MPTGRHRRSIKSAKLTTNSHIRYLGLWVLMCFCLIALLTVTLYRLEQQTIDVLVPQDAETLVYQMALQSQVTNRLVMGTLLLVTGVLALAVLTAHRLAGPYIALRRTIDYIQAGHPEHRLHFRAYDHLEDVEESFNGLLDTLTEQKTAEEKAEAASRKAA